MVHDTRSVFALLAGVVMALGVLASLTDRGVLGSKLLAVGFAIATVWATLGFFWSADHQTALGTTNYIALGSMAAVAAIYYGYKGANGVPLTDSI
ncbi:MAG: hypothetical protein ABEH90_09305 [Halolamina sp.]